MFKKHYFNIVIDLKSKEGTMHNLFKFIHSYLFVIVQLKHMNNIFVLVTTLQSTLFPQMLTLKNSDAIVYTN